MQHRNCGPMRLAAIGSAMLAAAWPCAAGAQIVTHLGKLPFRSGNTVPSNGDVNPYGVAVVPDGFPASGLLHAGDILVSNFNNSQNQQGTRTTIVSIAPNNAQTVFFQGSMGLGLTTALGVLKHGVVLVGNVPTMDGTSATVQQGSLIALDRFGRVIANLTDANFLDGPWDLTTFEAGPVAVVFVSNVLSGTVTRIDLHVGPNGESLKVLKMTQIASGYNTRTDPNALVVGPTGVVFNAERNTLYVASTGNNAIFSIPDALTTNKDHGMGTLVYMDSVHLHGPLGLVLAPNGDLISSQGDAQNPDANQASEIVEFTKEGQFIGQFQLESQEGGAFGIAIAEMHGAIVFAAVDDIMNTVDVWQIRHEHH